MTFNTGNPIGSTDARDRSDNSENLDLAVNSLALTFEDRLGVTRDTLEGIYQKSAYYRAGTFDAGYTLTNNRQTLAYGNIEYSWSGAFPKVVAAGATPATSGGIGAGAWVDRTDVTLRDEVDKIAVARSLNVTNGNVIYSTDTTTVLDNVLYIYDAATQITWGVPSGVGAGEVIVSVVGDILETDGAGSPYALDTDIVSVASAVNGTQTLGNLAQRSALIHTATNNTLGNKTQMIAHRGLGLTFPENTLHAFSCCHALGITGIETDVSFSSDGVAYCFHDLTVDSLTNGTGTFTTLTSAYIDTLTFKSTAGTILAAEPIPKFNDVLAFCRLKGLSIEAEAKNLRTDADFYLIVDLVAAANMTPLVNICNGFFGNMALLREYSGEIGIVYIGNPTAQEVADLQILGNSGISVNELIDAEIVTQAKLFGLRVLGWSINNSDQADIFRAKGVNVLLVDRLIEGVK